MKILKKLNNVGLLEELNKNVSKHTKKAKIKKDLVINDESVKSEK